MKKRTVKIVCSLLMIGCLMTPSITPFVAKDWYKMVLSGSNEEENKTENQKNGEAKFWGERDLFLYEESFFTFERKGATVNNYCRVTLQNLLTFDIILPPPEWI